MKPEQKTEDVNFTEKIAPVESVTIELPKSIIDFKDKANTQFANGQYSDAFEFYSFAIDALKSEKTSNFILKVLLCLTENYAIKIEIFE